MLSRLETESEVATQFSPSMTVKGEVIRYRIYDDVSEYMDVLWDQGAVSVEPEHLVGKTIYVHSVWDNSARQDAA